MVGLPVNKFEWVEDTSKFNEDFIKNYNEESNEEYFLEVYVQYPEKFHELHNDLPFLPERMKLEEVEKHVVNLYDKTGLSHGLILKKVHWVIRFNQKAWLKPYIDMNAKLRQKGKNNFEKDSFKLMNNAVFIKTMANVRKHRILGLSISE